MDELELQEAIIAKRHKEVLSALKAIYDKLTATPSSLNEDIKRVLVSLEQSIKEPKNDEIVEEIKKLSDTWMVAVEELKPSEVDNWIFTIERDSQGFIKTVEAERKP
jgi:hypothetical protein